MNPRSIIACVVPLCMSVGSHAQTLIWSNAAVNGLTGLGLATDPRPAGGFYSRLQGANADLGQLSDGLDMIGDTFVLTRRTLVTDVYLYAYFQGTTLPIIGGSMVIRTDGPNGSPLQANNGQVTAEFTDIYRVTQTETVTTRRIQRLRFDLNDRVLEPGTYFIKFTTEARGSFSPFIPYLTKPGATTLPGANSMHQSGFTGGWVPIRDSATLQKVEIPFEVWGTEVPVTETPLHAPPPRTRK